MSNHEVYFANHKKALRFPWSLYHVPLLESLNEFLKSSVKNGSKVLVIGPGDFQEIDLLSTLGSEIYLLDIDPRVLELNIERHGSRIKKTFLVDENFGGYPVGLEFDAIYAKEVVEHIPEYKSFLKKLNSLLTTNGRVWLSTPNYGHFILPLLERTALELIARLSGFSRKDIHPSKFGKDSLEAAMKETGFKNLSVSETPFKFALTAIAQKG